MANELVLFDIVEAAPSAKTSTVYQVDCLYGVKVLQRAPLPLQWEVIEEPTDTPPETPRRVTPVAWTTIVVSGAIGAVILTTAIGAGGFLPGLAIGAVAFFVWDLGRDG